MGLKAWRRTFALAGAAVLASCGSPRQEAADNAASAGGDAASRPAAFAVCASCHNAEPGGRHGVGPNLAGVIGAKAGSKPGYNYSAAIKESGIVWTPELVARFIENPTATVPGTRMMIRGPKDPAAQKAITDYLASTR